VENLKPQFHKMLDFHGRGSIIATACASEIVSMMSSHVFSVLRWVSLRYDLLLHLCGSKINTVLSLF
jgi:hypothetical protein